MPHREPKPEFGGSGELAGNDAAYDPSAIPTATTWPAGRGPVSNAGHPQPPSQIGQYLLGREIGSGGMGRVYEATDLTLSRPVAIKVIKSGMASTAAAERFILESQTLAKFTHPGIAQIFAAGHFEDPQAPLHRTPYFVMEYVQGAKSITEFTAAHHLDIDARVRLFIKVCESIEHAHRHRIIHRDLKPSNIMVGDFPHIRGEHTNAQPKVIDFGIARNIDTQLLQAPVNQLVGTLEYMSPEQCDGQPLDERSDLYSLAVVLYQLLSGTLPYPVVGAATTQDVVTVIRAGSLKPLRAASPGVSADLEAVIMRALAKSPLARYPSVSRFRADLERYLAGEAVEARWDSVLYVTARRARWWIGFHPRASLLSALAVIVILVLTAGLFLIFDATGIDRVYGRLQARVTGNVMLGQSPQHSVLVGIFKPIDLDRIGRLTAGKGLMTASGEPTRLSLRGTLGVLLERLAPARPAALGFDITFLAEGDEVDGRGTGVLCGGLERFAQHTHFRPVAIAPPHIHDRTAREAATLSESVSPLCVPAVGLTGVSWGNMVSQYAYVREPGHAPHVSLSLAMLAAPDYAAAVSAPSQSQPPTLPPHTLLCMRDDSQEGRLSLELLYPGLPPRSQGSGTHVRFASVETVTPRGRTSPPADPGGGLDAGEEVGLLHVQIPPRSYFDAVTLDVLDVLEMSPAQVQKAFGGKHVFVANMQPMNAPGAELPASGSNEGGDFVSLDDGRSIPGVWTHMATLESIMTGRTIIPISPLGVATSAAAAAVLGAGLAIRFFLRPLVLVSLLCLFVVVMVSASLGWFAWRLEVLNPLIPALAMLLAALTSRIGVAAGRPVRGRGGLRG